ncbi:hypothetical protein C6I21_06555 [Alkalicoccus urumqiensis]|uniref:Uncharacterized protein n=1 Tax=Alkalicoccus urumqiensis TaxID=1548213 RepID=A0A2P6MI65_ALKUR|nr:hypothetical protein C6I21_06555 [Alkalicoccus urumqiensis]
MNRSGIDVYKAEMISYNSIGLQHSLCERDCFYQAFSFYLSKPEAVDSGRIRTRRKSIPSDGRKKELVEPVPSGTRTAAGAGRNREPIQQISLCF